jgi:CDP-diacylglycerol---serine O-phosphatidyltransferase
MPARKLPKFRRSAQRRLARFDALQSLDGDIAAEPGMQPLADEHRETRAKPGRGLYILPNALTTANLFCGFYAIVMAMNGRFEMAAIGVFFALVFDGLDGRVARMTNTQSAFGEQYDSLADVISFGAAPALIIYEWSLKGMGKWGWLAAFVYVAGAALRLARFNTNIGVVDKRYFQGLPSPASAALIAGLVWIVTDLRQEKWISWGGPDIKWVAFALTIYAGLTMVSNAPFYSFKDINLRKKVPFVFALLLMGAFITISADPPLMLFTLFLVYGLSGWVLMLWRMRTGKQLPGGAPKAYKDSNLSD